MAMTGEIAVKYLPATADVLRGTSGPGAQSQSKGGAARCRAQRSFDAAALLGRYRELIWQAAVA
jgi:hypothetical protein